MALSDEAISQGRFLRFGLRGGFLDKAPWTQVNCPLAGPDCAVEGLCPTTSLPAHWDFFLARLIAARAVARPTRTLTTRTFPDGAFSTRATGSSDRSWDNGRAEVVIGT